MKNKILFLGIVLMLPVLLLAGGTPPPNPLPPDTNTILTSVSSILTLVKNIIFALALIGFFYGLMKFIFSVGNGKEEGKTIMIWGIITLFIMFSIWGIITILQTSFKGTSGGYVGTPGIPMFNGVSSKIYDIDSDTTVTPTTGTGTGSKNK